MARNMRRSASGCTAALASPESVRARLEMSFILPCSATRPATASPKLFVIQSAEFATYFGTLKR